MQYRAAVFAAEVDRGAYRVLGGVDGRVRGDDALGLLGDDLLDQRGDVVIVVIEGVAVDPAFVNDHPDGDAAQRVFIKKSHKCGFYRGLREVRHSVFLRGV